MFWLKRNWKKKKERLCDIEMTNQIKSQIKMKVICTLDLLTLRLH